MEKEISEKMIEYLGGKDNISLFTHCATRLRFDLKDKEKADPEKIGSLEGVIGTQITGDQFQVIIGQDAAEAYDQICKDHGFERKDTAEKLVKSDCISKQ